MTTPKGSRTFGDTVWKWGLSRTVRLQTIEKTETDRGSRRLKGLKKTTTSVGSKWRRKGEDRSLLTLPLMGTSSSGRSGPGVSRTPRKSSPRKVKRSNKVRATSGRGLVPGLLALGSNETKGHPDGGPGLGRGSGSEGRGVWVVPLTATLPRASSSDTSTPASSRRVSPLPDYTIRTVGSSEDRARVS